MEILFFADSKDLRKWFRRHHATVKEIWIGFYRKDSGRRSITWPESVDEALCVGWIDGIRKRIDEVSYMIRFTPRRRLSNWSAVNIKRAAALTNAKRMQPAGLAAFGARREDESRIYSYEQRRDHLEEPYQSRLRSHQKAWAFFQAQSPSYRKVLCWWVTSAKQEPTRQKRLEKLIGESERGKRL